MEVEEKLLYMLCVVFVSVICSALYFDFLVLNGQAVPFMWGFPLQVVIEAFAVALAPWTLLLLEKPELTKYIFMSVLFLEGLDWALNFAIFGLSLILVHELSKAALLIVSSFLTSWFLSIKINIKK